MSMLSRIRYSQLCDDVGRPSTSERPATAYTDRAGYQAIRSHSLFHQQCVSRSADKFYLTIYELTNTADFDARVLKLIAILAWYLPTLVTKKSEDSSLQPLTSS